MRRYRRYLRFAFSAFCGIVCLLLIVFWVRSYYVPLKLTRPGRAAVGIQSNRGRLIVGRFDLDLTWDKMPPNLGETLAADPQYAALDKQLKEQAQMLRLLKKQPDQSGQLEIQLRMHIGTLDKFSRYEGQLVRAAILNQQKLIAVPHWVPVLIFATLGALPWLPWWSNRFSLRTLLIAMTLLAVALGVIVGLSR